MQDLVKEVLAHDTPACWTNEGTHKQHSRAGAPSWSRARSSSGREADGQGPGQRRQMHPQLQQSWPAPDGGRYVLATPPLSKKQQPGDRSTRAGWKAQHPSQRSSPPGSPDNGCALCSPSHPLLYKDGTRILSLTFMSPPWRTSGQSVLLNIG